MAPAIASHRARAVESCADVLLSRLRRSVQESKAEFVGLVDDSGQGSVVGSGMRAECCFQAVDLTESGQRVQVGHGGTDGRVVQRCWFLVGRGQ